MRTAGALVAQWYVQDSCWQRAPAACASTAPGSVRHTGTLAADPVTPADVLSLPARPLYASLLFVASAGGAPAAGAGRRVTSGEVVLPLPVAERILFKVSSNSHPCMVRHAAADCGVFSLATCGWPVTRT